MALSYNKLWKLLIDKGMNKTDLKNITGLCQSTIAKLTNGENVNTDILERICDALGCELEDIVEIDKRGEKQNESKLSKPLEGIKRKKYYD